MIKKRYLVVASVLFAMAASSSAWAQQYARPDGVQSTGTWTAVNAGTHHEAVNEASFSDGDYIDSGLGNDSTIIFTLSDITDPGTYANNHIIRYRCQATVGNKPKGGEGCDAALYLGNTQIATTNVSANRGAFAPATLTIIDASALAGANYANLEIRITSSSLDVDESIQVSWVELEVPASATSAPSVTTNAATGVTQNQATLGGNVTLTPKTLPAW
jgi:hypothetical protein